jgi:UDP-GlcNAc:undecaprenyl-phosphate GlcNAc-1-phosphate transferase
MPLLWPALVALAVALAVTPLVMRLAFATGAIDDPKAASRKHHARPTALLGGLAVLAAIAAGVAVAVWAGLLPGDSFRLKNLLGILVGLLVLNVGGYLDDRYNLPPRLAILSPLLAVCCVVASGIGIDYVSNPFGDALRLDGLQYILFWWHGVPYKFTVIADLFTVAWLMTMTYTTKLTDGVDGLVSGLTVIGAVIITAVCFMKEVSQPDTAVLALIVGAAFLGFLVYNFNPARIFLGEGGSTMAGFLLGILAIISGGKIATTLLVLGLPLFDAALVVLNRWRAGKSPFRTSDRTHLHFRLLDAGLTQRQVVLMFWFVTLAFGISTLLLTGWEKVAALLALVSLTLGGGSFFFAWRDRTR